MSCNLHRYVRIGTRHVPLYTVNTALSYSINEKETTVAVNTSFQRMLFFLT